MRGRFFRQTWHYNPTHYAPARYQTSCAYEAFIPDAIAGTAVRLVGRTARIVSDAEAAIGHLNANFQPVLASIARSLLRTESIASSNVAGIQMTARELAKAEARLGAGRPAGATAQDIVSNIEAMETAVTIASQAATFTPDDVAAIHRRLMERSGTPQAAGRWRTSQSWIGGNDYNPHGAAYVPPPVRFIGELMVDLCAAINDDSLSPLVQAALVHAQFEAIHPFDSGNGRTGRALVQVVLRRRSKADCYVPPISMPLGDDRARYVAGLTRYRAGDVEGWIEQFAVAAAKASILAQSQVMATRDLIDEWREDLIAHRPVRADAAALAIIDVLPAHPVITAPNATAATGRAKSAIHPAIAELEAAGVLLPLSRAKRNRTWEARGLLDCSRGPVRP